MVRKRKGVWATGRKDATSPQRIMIGGQINDEIRKCADAEAHGQDAMAAVLLAKGWIGGK